MPKKEKEYAINANKYLFTELYIGDIDMLIDVRILNVNYSLIYRWEVVGRFYIPGMVSKTEDITLSSNTCKKAAIKSLNTIHSQITLKRSTWKVNE